MAADALAYFYVIKYHIFKTEYIFDAFFFFFLQQAFFWPNTVIVTVIHVHENTVKNIMCKISLWFHGVQLGWGFLPGNMLSPVHIGHLGN